jgi:hypothetical protein
VPGNARGFELKEADEQQLRAWTSAFGTPQQVALRCHIVLSAAEGSSDYEIAAKLEVNRKTVMLWRRRFEKKGPEGLWEAASGRGRKATYGPEKIQSIVDMTLRGKPKGMTHWSCRTLASAQGVSKSTVNSIWQSHNLKPHSEQDLQAVRGCPVSRQVNGRSGFVPKSATAGYRIVRRRKKPDSSSGSHQPGLPWKKGRCGTMTHASATAQRLCLLPWNCCRDE